MRLAAWPGFSSAYPQPPRGCLSTSGAAGRAESPWVSRLGRGALGPDQSRSTIVMAFQSFIGIRSRFRLES